VTFPIVLVFAVPLAFAVALVTVHLVRRERVATEPT